MTRFRITKKDAYAFTPAGHEGVVDWEMVGPKTSGASRVSVWIGELSERGVADPHTHEEQEQVYYPLEGSLRIMIGGEEFETQAGDGSIYFVPPKTPHAVYAAGHHAKVLVITSPAVTVA